MTHTCKAFAVLALLLPLSLAAADPEAPPVVTLPSLPVVPSPAPPPTAITKLTGSQLYVITSTQPVLVLGSRDGLIKVASPKTPVTLYGAFVDPQPGDDDGRTYTKGHVYIVRAAGNGEVELIVAPDLSGKNLIRRVLQVSVEPSPTPPGPGPGPTPDPLVASLQAAFTADVGATKGGQLVLLTSIMEEASRSALDPTVTTTQQLANAVHAVTEQKVGEKAKGALTKTRDAAGLFLNANMPALSKNPITDAERKQVSAAYARVGAALRGVK